MRCAWLALAGLVVAGCSDSAPGDSPTDGGLVDTGASLDAAGDAPLADAELDAAAPDADAGFLKTYRNSLSVCWTDASCPRVLAVGHGGAWKASGPPYDSDGAIHAAYDADLDGVKIDVRVTLDDVPVISHSSPLQVYESLDCNGKKIEELTAAQVEQCHRFPSQTETFQRMDGVLDYLRGKMVVQLCVKESRDYARTIEAVHAAHAEDFAFLEISTGELRDLIPTLPGSDTVYYLINVASTLSEVDELIDVIKNPRAFMYEFDSNVQLGTLASARLHPAGIRSFTYDSSASASAAQLQALFDGGYDVVSSQVASSDVAARRAVNQARGVTPP